ncbi:MAG: hypothetical protein ACR2MT_11980 [Aurantibacter sp.]
MKTNILYLSSLLFIISSCSKEASFTSESDEIHNLELKASPPVDCSTKFLTAGLVDEGACQGSLRRYSIYVTAGYGGQRPYLRQIEVYITKKINNSFWILDAAIVNIPANATVSNNSDVFDFDVADRKYGKVDLIIASVTKSNGVVDSCYLPRKTSPTANNCYYDEPKFRPELGYVLNDDDFDNDGISNKDDKDDDGDGTWDVFDGDDDNDGTNDDFDTDDDNDGLPDGQDPDKKS